MKKIVIKLIWFVIILFLLKEVFSEILVELGLQFRITYITSNRYENLGLLKNICILFFGLTYSSINGLLLRKNKSVFRSICNSLDFFLIGIAVAYAILIIIDMTNSPGEAAFGLMLLPISATIIGFAVYSLALNKEDTPKYPRNST